MSSDIEAFLDEVDRWKFKAYKRLKGLTPQQRQAFWNRVGQQARKMGLPVVEPGEPTQRPAQRVRRTG